MLLCLDSGRTCLHDIGSDATCCCQLALAAPFLAGHRMVCLRSRARPPARRRSRCSSTASHRTTLSRSGPARCSRSSCLHAYMHLNLLHRGGLNDQITTAANQPDVTAREPAAQLETAKPVEVQPNLSLQPCKPTTGKRRRAGDRERRGVPPARDVHSCRGGRGAGRRPRAAAAPGEARQ